MKSLNSLVRFTPPGLAPALGVTFVAATALSHPYATCLTNDSGVISFRLNEAADTAKVLWNGGSSSFTLGPLARGLTVTNLTTQGITSPFQVEVTKAGAGVPTLISDNNNVLNQFYGPRAVAVNKRPASPYFGRIYVGNAPGTTASGRPTGDGIYVLNADSTDAVGQGDTALTAGIDMTTGGSSMPWRMRVGQDDDQLYICDWSDAAGNLWVADPNVSAASGVAIFMAPIGTMASPLDASMNHGSISEVYVTGSRATSDLTVFTVDEDYETNPGFKSELNSLWQYNIGTGPLPWSTLPDAKLATPAVAFTGQTMGLDRGANGFFYLLNNRSSGNENCLQVIDPSGPTVVYESRPDSMNNYGFPRDILSNCTSVAVSPDQKYLAAQRGSGIVVIVPLVDGIPNLAGRVEFSAIGTARQIAFDAANNVYVISAATERLRIYSLGLTTTAKTGSDGTFSITTPAATVNVAADTDTLNEGGPTTAVLTFTRTADSLANPLTIAFTTAGTAVRGTDYVLQTNSVTFTGNSVIIPAGADSVTISVVAQNDEVAEFTETVTVNVAGTTFYSAGTPASQTIALLDNEAPMADLAVVYGSMYERLAYDYARLRVVRRGDTNAASFDVNLTYSGTAAASRYAAPATVTIEPGVVNQNFDITPADDSLLNGNETIIATVASGTGYVVGTNSPSATATIVDDELPPETVLWSADFNTDDSANWTVRFGSGNDVPDYRYVFSYDYAAAGWIPSIPAAPHGTDTLGLYLTVNKDDATGLGAAGINVYPNGKSFSGNYAVRFDMYLMVGNAASTTEYALFGINHSGEKANWFRNSTGGVPGGVFDGLFFGVEADGAALGDYVIYSAPTTAGNNPTALTPGVNASTLTGIFKVPPFGGGLAGAPGNSELSTTPCWADVEIRHFNGVVTLIINRTPIMSYTNATAFTSGNLMLGYCDAYDSVMSGNSGVVYDNLRVVRLASTSRPNITNIQLVGGNVEISFAGEAGDTTADFALQEAGTVNSTYGDVSATITGSAGSFKAVRAVGDSPRFYRIKRVN